MYENNLKKTAVLNWGLGFEVEFDYEVLDEHLGCVVLRSEDIEITVQPCNIRRMEMSSGDAL